MPSGRAVTAAKAAPPSSSATPRCTSSAKVPSLISNVVVGARDERPELPDRRPDARPSTSRHLCLHPEVLRLSVLPALVVLLLAGCSDELPTVDEANVAFCVSPDRMPSQTGRVDIEFRQDGDVVGSASAAVGTAVSVRVPTGRIDVYANGEYSGTADSPGPSAADDDGAPLGGVYLSGPGCPTQPPFG